jgi:26S proteasome regulatory subunit T2
MEEEFIKNQERLKPQEERQEEERVKVDDMRGNPMAVGTLEEVIDDQHAIVSTVRGLAWPYFAFCLHIHHIPERGQ